MALINIKFCSRQEKFFYNALDKSSDQSLCIKGLFALVIVLQHARSYYSLSSAWYNDIFSQTLNFIGQLMVVMFLFYSGYGIIKSYQKNSNYFSSFPRTRILKTIVHFDLAILLFLVLNACLNIKFGVVDTLLSFTAWTSIGNSNWFIFTIVMEYIAIYLAHLLVKDSSALCYVSLAFSLVIMVVLIFTKESWWYSTMLSLPFGMLYANYQQKIEGAVLKNNKTYGLTLAGGGGAIFNFKHN